MHQQVYVIVFSVELWQLCVCGRPVVACELFDLTDWVVDLSPFNTVPRLSAAELVPAPVLVLVALTAGLFAAYLHRRELSITA